MINERRAQPGIILIVVCYLLLGVAYSIVVPLAETPDESEHFNYLQHIALTNSLPLMQPLREENVTLEAHQPPLLYLLGAVLTSPIEMDPADNLPENNCFSFEPEDNGRQHAFLHRPQEWPPQLGVYQVFQVMRWLSVVMGAVTVWVTYKIGQQVADGRLPFIAAAVLAFNPQWIHITASLNNDVPTTMLGGAVIFLCIIGAKQPRLRIFAGLGLLLGLGFLTKFALLAFWPLAILAAFAPFLHKNLRRTLHACRTNLQSLIPHLLLLILLPILTAGWWYWRGFRLHGDPLMWDVTLAAKGSVIARTAPFTLADFGEFLLMHFQSYWLWFGWLNIKGPDWLYLLFFLVAVTAVAGLVKLVWQKPFLVNGWAVAFCVLGILVIYASLLQYIQTINWTGYQGRLAYAAAAPIAVLLALGLVSLNQRWLGTAVAGGLFLISTLAIPLLLLPAYPRPVIYQPATELTRTCLRFEGGLQLEAISAAAAVKPGEQLPVTIYGYGLNNTDQPQTVAVDLVGWQDEILGQSQQQMRWQAGEVVSATMVLPVADSLPTRGLLRLTMPGQRATSATGRVLTLPQAVETVKIAPERPFQPQPMFQTNIQFGDFLKLVGYDLPADAAEITLYWQALTAMADDYTTFVHILNDEGQLIGQADSQPADGRYPTSLWAPSEIVADPKELPAGEGQIVVGVYLWPALERLPAFDEAGRQLPHDQYLLPEVE